VPFARFSTIPVPLPPRTGRSPETAHPALTADTLVIPAVRACSCRASVPSAETRADPPDWPPKMTVDAR